GGRELVPVVAAGDGAQGGAGAAEVLGRGEAVVGLGVKGRAARDDQVVADAGATHAGVVGAGAGGGEVDGLVQVRGAGGAARQGRARGVLQVHVRPGAGQPFQAQGHVLPGRQ